RVAPDLRPPHRRGRRATPLHGDEGSGEVTAAPPCGAWTRSLDWLYSLGLAGSSYAISATRRRAHSRAPRRWNPASQAATEDVRQLRAQRDVRGLRRSDSPRPDRLRDDLRRGTRAELHVPPRLRRVVGGRVPSSWSPRVQPRRSPPPRPI